MEFARKIQDDRSSNIMSYITYRFLPYWPLFVLFLAVGIGCGYAYMRYATPMYETTATLLIKDEKKGASESKTVESLDMLSTKKIIENEMEVIQSGTLVYKVVNKLHLYAPVYKKGRIRDESAYSTSPIGVEIDSAGVIKPADKIYFRYNKDKAAVVINNKAYPVNTWLITPFGKLRFIEKVGSYDDADQFYFSIVDPRVVANSIRTALEVTTSNKMTSILNLSLKDADPQRGEDILNELLFAYNEAIIQDKNTLAGNTLRFVEARLDAVEHDLDSIERKIQQYKAQKGVVDIGTQGRLFLENVSSNDQKVSELNMQLAVLKQVENFVNASGNTSTPVPSTLGISDPALSQLIDKLNTSELEYERLRKTTAENNPLITSVRDQIDNLRPKVMATIQSQKRSLEASRVNINTTNNLYSDVLRRMPEQERQLIDINREQSIKNGIYTFLLQKREETALSYASTVSDSRVIDRATSSAKPVNPKKKVVYLSSVLIALLAGAGFVYGRESFGRKIMFRQEIEQLTLAPIVGEISTESSKNALVISNVKKTFIAEQFRRLRLSLSYMGISSKRKRILVTSSIAGEGKSFVATNLALTLALANKKVVLLDFDLNNPTLNKKLQITQQKGIADYLESNAEVADITVVTEAHPNFYVITAGSLPDNPTELIMNGKAEALLAELETQFDYIIMDTAPVIPVTDAYILSAFSDATLYVVRHGYTPKVFIERLDENNKINHLNNVAIVFNDVTPRGIGASHYGYGYGYGYIYDDRESRKRLAYKA